MKAQLGECYLLNTRGTDYDNWGFAEEMLPLNRNLVVIKESNFAIGVWEPHFYIPRQAYLYADTWGIYFNDTIKLTKRG